MLINPEAEQAEPMKLRFPALRQDSALVLPEPGAAGGGVPVLVRAQFHYGLDWLLAAGAGERIQAISDVIVSDLADRPRSEWNAVLKRFDDAYQIQFLLFDNNEGTQIAGEAIHCRPRCGRAFPDRAGTRLGAARADRAI